jgi:poly(3-hydroxybutyrate) depolymerase
MSKRCPFSVGPGAIALATCIALAACSRGGDTVVNVPTSPATQASASPSPTPSSTPAAPLKIPERVASGAVTETRGSWDKKVQRIRYLSSADNTQQPMMFYKPQPQEPRPLVVALHSWSNDYTQTDSVIYSEWCIANDWNFIHPNFRGANRRPETTGSELVIADVLSAIDYAKANARVDESRIYAIGWSGGGYLGLLLAGRAPEIWAGVSATGPILDLSVWYEESKRLGTKYVREISASCGGTPTDDTPAAAECRKRSPVAYLERARDIPIDLIHGIYDGRTRAHPVPVSHALNAFNLLGAPQDRLTEEQILSFTKEAQVPVSLRDATPADSNDGDLKVLFRRQSGNVRLTVFDGGHVKYTEVAFRWLNEQRRH